MGGGGGGGKCTGKLFTQPDKIIALLDQTITVPVGYLIIPGVSL